MAGYDPKKAAEYNRLIQQGVDPEAAIAQAGITYEEQGNYEINSIGTSATNRDYGRMSDIALPQNNTSGVNPAIDPSQFPAYDDDGNLQPGFAINNETGGTYYQGFERNTDQPVNPAIDPSQFPAYDDNGFLQPGFAVNNETGETYFQGVGPLTQQNTTSLNDPYYGLTSTQLQDLGGADPTDPYIRARLGIPQLPGSTLAATPGFGTIKTGVPAIDSALGIIGGGFTSLFSNFSSTIGGLFGPKPTATAVASTTGMSVAGLTTPAPTPPTTDQPVNPASDPSQFPAYDDDGNLQPGFAVNDETGGTYYRGFPSQDVTNQPVNPASDPSQFPAYDDDGNLQPGFAVNDETGGTYYQGFERTYNEPLDPNEDPFEQSRYEAELAYNAQEPYEVAALSVDDPYYGLTPTQLQDLGGADPTDPYIRARLGIPQLPGETLVATPGFGTIKTGVPIIDSALSFLGGLFGGPVATPPTPAAPEVSPASDPSQFPAYDDDGNLQPGFAINDETGETYYQGFERSTDAPVNPASDPSQFPAYDDDGNLQPGFAINDETGGTYYQGVGPVTGADVTTLSDEEADALFSGTGTPTAAQQAATNEQTAADAAALYPGTNNTNLKNINEASVAVAQNEAGIANAQDIIAQNNAELADPDISDERRAELEANNAAQENYIRLAEDNTAENELVIESNADAFAAGGGEPDSGQGPLEVAALEDPGLETPEAILEPDPDAAFPEDVDPDADPEIPQAELEPDPDAAFPEDVDPDVDAELQEPPGTEEEITELAEPVDPDADPELLGGPDEEVDVNAPLEEPPDVDAAEDPELLGGPDEEEEGPELLGGPEDVDTAEDDGLKTPDGQEEADGTAGTGLQEPTDADVEQANQEAAVRDKAKQQATFQARYKQPGNADWRVRLSLARDSQYLYNEKDSVGILAPLTATDGVIFPYTPSITTTYSANYEQYDLVHSNYRGLFYKNSRVGDIQIRGTFTAQDTKEADYLLAVIHFFRSATKMFYGQDAQRGVPPPVCLLNGLGQYQFSDHPVVISSFNYTLPNDVDYIRAGSPNNYGVNMLNRRAAVGSNPGGQSLAGLNRLTNALLKKGAPGTGVPDPSAIQQNVSNTAGASYVPTKIEIDITLIPVQTRSQVSKQFSLKDFANGQLLKGGFW